MQLFSHSVPVLLFNALLWRLVDSSFPKVQPKVLLQLSRGREHGGNLVEATSKDASMQPLSKLMSSGLESWGLHQAIAVDSDGSHAHLHPEVEPAEPPLLSLMSLDLDTWGSKIKANSSVANQEDNADQAADFVTNPLAQVLPSEVNLFDQRGFQPQHMSFFLEPRGKSSFRNFGVMILIVLLLALILSCLCWEGVSLDDAELVTPNQAEQEAAGSGFATVEFSDGSWAQVYREAQGDQKEALELLFRCNIISTDEFAFSSVSQEHIQECMWIAEHMLRQKPLEEWVALWQQAQQTFEDSVTACFEARGGPHSNNEAEFFRPQAPQMVVSSLSLGAVPLSGVSRMSSSIGEDDYEDDPYTTRSHYTPGGMQEPPPYGSQDPSSQYGMRLPDTQESHADSENSRWTIESELNEGLAVHGLK